MKKELAIWSRVYRFLSVLLVTTVLSLSVVPLLHAHNDELRSLKTGATEYTKAVEKCQICDFLIHKQQKDFVLSASPALQLPFSFSLSKTVDRPVALCKFSLPGFTNKGPPAVPAFA